jgi:hypothetical protein
MVMLDVIAEILLYEIFSTPVLPPFAKELLPYSHKKPHMPKIHTKDPTRQSHSSDPPPHSSHPALETLSKSHCPLPTHRDLCFEK